MSGNRCLCSDGYVIYLVLFFPPLQWVGSPCGLHGPYIFYKAFQFHLEGKPRILSLGDFFFVRCTPKDPICIAELQLLWEERTSRQLLSSSKLYFLPEDTPQGRNSDHGEVVNLYLPLFFLYYFFPSNAYYRASLKILYSLLQSSRIDSFFKGVAPLAGALVFCHCQSLAVSFTKRIQLLILVKIK